MTALPSTAEDRGGRWSKSGSGGAKSVKLACLLVCKWLGLFWVARQVTRRGVRILCYHGIWLGEEGFVGDAMFMPKDTFENRLDILIRQGYPVITLSAAVDSICGGAIIPARSVVITIDDGWYSSFLYMFSALLNRGMPVTLYCDTAHLQDGLPIVNVMAAYLRKVHLSESTESTEIRDANFALATDRSLPVDRRSDAVHAIAEHYGINADVYLRRRAFSYMSPGELKEAARAGVDVQLHTHRHTMHDLSPEKLREEIVENRRELARIIERDAREFRHFCYPSGIASDRLGGELDSLRIKSATTTQQGLAWPGANRHLLPRILDGGHLHKIEFEAEISGFSEFTRPIRRMLGKLLFSRPGRIGAT